MKQIRLIIFLSVLAVGTLFSAKSVSASEGTIEMESTTDENYRCFAASIRMQNQEFRIPFTCKNLIYPADENIFNYVMWATPRDGGESIKLGALGLGRGEFRTKKAFNSLFVTTERARDVKTPQGKTVMRGNVESIAFLLEETTPTPTPTPAEVQEGEQVEEEKPAELTTREKFVLALKRAGIAALIALVALVGLIFVVTRSRG